MKKLLAGLALALASCGGSAAPSPTALPLPTLAPTPAPTVAPTSAPTIAPAPPSYNAPGFDASHVAEGWSESCTNSSTSDTYFCTQLVFSAFAADGTTLIVPTTFESKDTSKADFVCSLLAKAHFEADRTTPLGYEDVVVLDKNGGQLASCPIV